MNFYQRAFRYLWRKRVKTLLLLLVLLFVNSLILGMSMILRATEESKAAMQAKSGSKVVLEVTDRNIWITEEELERVKELDGVTSVNRLARGTVFLADFSPLTGSESTEENNRKVTLLSCDRLENDSPFEEQVYRLTEGRYITGDTERSVVMNALLAEACGLKVGDELRFETPEGKIVSAGIAGTFLSGGERKQDSEIPAVNRTENQVFVDHKTFSELFENQGYYKAAVYSSLPEQLGELEAQLGDIFPEKVGITSSDALLQQMKAPLEQVIQVAELMLTLTFLTGTVVVTLLLCMWMRTRQREMAILISLGVKKTGIFLQAFLEAATVFGIAAAGACILGNGLAGLLQSMMTGAVAGNLSLEVSLKAGDIAGLAWTGGLVVVIAVGCSLLPVLRANPRDTLSKMEG